MRLRLVSWNIHSCVGIDKRYDPGRIASVLADLDADIIGLQEVDWRSPQHEGVDQLAFLARELEMTAVAGPNLYDHRGEFGNALLTRLAVEEVEHLDLAQPGREPRGCIDARLRHEGHHIRALVTHLGLRRDERAIQLNDIADHLGHETGEVRCLLADINEWLPTRFTRGPLVPACFDAVYAPRTFPSRRPVFPLDRVFVSPLPDKLDHARLRTPLSRLASDHLPVLVDVGWQDKAGLTSRIGGWSE